jgi:hypothetical protein
VRELGEREGARYREGEGYKDRSTAEETRRKSK